MRNFVLIAAAALALARPGAAGAEGGAPTGALNLVAMDEIRAPIVDGDRADGTLRFKLVLVARDAGGAAHLTAMLPVLRAVALAQGIEFGRLYASPMMPVDAGRLAAQLTAALHQRDAAIVRLLLVEVEAHQI